MCKQLIVAVSLIVLLGVACAVALRRPQTEKQAAVPRVVYELNGPTGELSAWHLFHCMLAGWGQKEFDDTTLTQYVLEDRRSLVVWDPEGGPMFKAKWNGASFPEAEAHFGQFLYCLWKGGCSANDRVEAKAGDVSLADLAKGLQARVGPEEDVSWALPVMLQWGDESWQAVDGAAWTLDSLSKQHIESRPINGPCFTHHWIEATASIARSPRVSAETRQRARELARREMDVLRARVQNDRMGSGDYLRAAQEAFSADCMRASDLSHALEWLVVIASERELESVWIRDLLNNVVDSSTRCTRLDVIAHCASAERSYWRERADRHRRSAALK